jgi:type VI secretion system protein ImpM
MSKFQPALTGFFGKLPARGDFVRHGLAEPMVAMLDHWCRDCLIQSRMALGEDWEQAWMTAPVWRFLLPPAALEGKSVLGLWLPSIDKAGRHYPFILAAVADDMAALAAGGGWLAMAEAEGMAGVVEDKPHQAIAAALAGPVADAPLPLPGWWTEGSPRVRPRRFDVQVLLTPTRYAGAMLRDHPAMEALP